MTEKIVSRKVRREKGHGTFLHEFYNISKINIVEVLKSKGGKDFVIWAMKGEAISLRTESLS